MISEKARLIILGREPVGSYGVDPIDFNGNASSDFTFLAWDRFEPSANAPAEEQDLTRAALGRSPHINIPINSSFDFVAPFVAAINAGSAGGEYQRGIGDVLCSAGFAEAIVSGTSATYTLSSQTTPSLAAYCFKRNLRTASPEWRMWPIYGGKIEELSIGGDAGKRLMVTGRGQSCNVPHDTTTTAAHEFGWSKSLAWFTANDIALDQFGDAMTHTGSLAHDMSIPMLNWAPTLTIDSLPYILSSWRLVVRNTLDIVLGGASRVVQEIRIGQREVSLEATLKDEEAVFDHMMSTITANYQGALADLLVPFSIAFTDGRGSSGTTCTITGKGQFDLPAYAPENMLSAHTLALKLTHDYVNDSFLGDEELSIALTETA